MIVRSAKPDDFKTIVDVGLDISKTIENKAHFNWSANVLEKELEKVQTLVLESAGELVSFLCYRDLGDVFEISVLATRPTSQKKNFQMSLLHTLQEFAAKQRSSISRSIILEVHAGNLKAIALYQKMGFILLHTRKQYYSDKGDALVMNWNSNKAGC